MQYHRPLTAIFDRASVHNSREKVRPYLAEMRRLRDAVQAMENMAANRDLTQTPEAHSLKVHQAALRIKQDLEATKPKATRFLNDGNFAISEAINNRLGLHETPRSAEIRSVFRALPGDKKMEVLSAAVKAGDRETLGAILRSNELLTGVPDQHRTAFYDDFSNQHAPELVEEAAALVDVDEAFQSFLRATDRAVTQGLQSDFVAKVNESRTKAQAASGAFETAMAGQVAA